MKRGRNMNFKNQLEKEYFGKMSKYFILVLAVIYAVIVIMRGMGSENMFAVMFFALMSATFASAETFARMIKRGLCVKMRLGLFIVALSLSGIVLNICSILLPREIAYSMLNITWPVLLALMTAYILATNCIIIKTRGKTY